MPGIPRHRYPVTQCAVPSCARSCEGEFTSGVCFGLLCRVVSCNGFTFRLGRTCEKIGVITAKAVWHCSVNGHIARPRAIRPDCLSRRNETGSLKKQGARKKSEDLRISSHSTNFSHRNLAPSPSSQPQQPPAPVPPKRLVGHGSYLKSPPVAAVRGTVHQQPPR